MDDFFHFLDQIGVMVVSATPAVASTLVASGLVAEAAPDFSWKALPSMDEFRKANGEQPPGPDFKGPALAVEWIELEGPLDADRGTRLLFGDLPLAPRRFLSTTKPLPVCGGNRSGATC